MKLSRINKSGIEVIFWYLIAIIFPFITFLWLLSKVVIYFASELGFLDPSTLPHWLNSVMKEVIGVILLFTTLILQVIRHTSNLPFFSKQASELSDKIDKITRASMEAFQTATGFIERAFGLQVTTNLREKHPDSILEALQALGFNLRNWEKHVTKKQDSKIVLIEDDNKIEVWLRYMRTYFFEEAFDIGRKELVTNGRNFCFILLATFQAFLERPQKSGTLHYYAVTPVHPKDWYNWPHGHGRFKPRAYFEEDFIGLFYRTLREILRWSEAQSKVIHGRFILTAEDPNAAPFGWKLDKPNDIMNHLRNTLMIPVAVPIRYLKEGKNNVVEAFGTYYDWLNERFPPFSDNRLVVPLFCSSWDWKVIENWFNNKINEVPSEDKGAWKNRKQNVKKAWDVLRSSIPQLRASTELTELAEKYHKEKIKKALEDIKPPSDRSQCLDAYEKIKFSAMDILNNKCIDFPKFTGQIHYYDVLLSEYGLLRKQLHLKSLLLASLRLRDCQLLNNNPKWLTLGEVFTQNLHSSPDLCSLVELNKKQMEEWYKKGVKPEFSFFGVQKEGNDNIEWKLIIATDLDYPFEVAKIRIIEPDDDEWKPYMHVITKLMEKKDYIFHPN